MVDLFGAELSPILRLGLALGVVLLLMYGLSFLLKKLGLSAMPAAKTGNARRLSLVDSLVLDARRRLVILKCDESEYVVILSTSGETVLEVRKTSVDSSAKPAPPSS
jgi:flagellar protein FliO/FliZ